MKKFLIWLFFLTTSALALDVNGELRNAQLQKLTSDPTGVIGQIFYDTDDHIFRLYSGSAWLSIADLTSTQTFTNKTLTSPKINENVVLTTTATKLNYLTSATGTTGTDSTNIVFSTSPTLVTPTLGVASATSINGTSIPSSKTLVVTTDKLSALSSTSSSELAGVLSDESGTGVAVFNTSPSLVTPALGVATANSLNVKPASSGTDVEVFDTTLNDASAGIYNSIGDSGTQFHTDFYNDLVTFTGDGDPDHGSVTIGNIPLILGTDLTLNSIGIKFSDGTHSGTLRPTTTPADFTLYFPSSDGSANQCLSTDGAGLLGWITAARATNNLSFFSSTTSAQLAGVLSDESGTGVAVYNTSPSLVTPSLGVASATSINGTSIPSSKTLVVTTDKLSALAATSSSELAGVLSDESGTGLAVYNTSPSLVTPSLGVATATSINSTTIPSSKTLVVTTDKLSALAATSSSELAGVLSDESGTGVAIFGTAPQFTTNADFKTGAEVRFYDSDDSNYVGFKAPSLSANKIWVLPNQDGSGNQCLKTDGSGNLGWATVATTAVASPTAAGLITSYFPTIQSAVSTTTNANLTATTSDGFLIYEFSTGASNRTFTLPAASANKGRTIIVKKIDSGAGTVGIHSAGSDTMDGAAIYGLTGYLSAIEMTSDGVANWDITYTTPPSTQHGVMLSGAVNSSPTVTAAGTNGQLLVGVSSADPVFSSTVSANTTFSGITTHSGNPSVGVHSTTNSSDQNSDVVITATFDAEDWDVGNNFNSSTSTFTAPLAGKYMVCADVCVQQRGTGVFIEGQVTAKVNGSTVARLFRNNIPNFTSPGFADITIGGCRTINMAASDTLTIAVSVGTATSTTNSWRNCADNTQEYLTIDKIQ